MAINDYYKNISTHIISTGRERLTSGFGMRVLNGIAEQHNGMDFTDTDRLELMQDVNILAFADGKVVEVINGSLVGWTAAITHEGKILTRYQHMKNGSVKVKVGDTVKKGDILGVMGTTGNSTGIHLHFAIKENSTYYDNGTYVNPETYLSGAKTTGIIQPVKPETSINAGDKAAILLTAAKYATGQTIPAYVKGEKFTIQQVKEDRILLKEIMSWVYIKDIQKV